MFLKYLTFNWTTRSVPKIPENAFKLYIFFGNCWVFIRFSIYKSLSKSNKAPTTAERDIFNNI